MENPCQNLDSDEIASKKDAGSVSNCYKSKPVSELMEDAERGGIDSGEDINLLWPYLRDKKNVLEVGAGYGRVIKKLNSLGFEGNITAIEQQSHYVKFLKEHYSNSNIIKEDFINYEFNQKYDSILWLFSGIIEHTIERQDHIIDKFISCLNKHGVLAIESFFTNEKFEKPYNATKLSDSQFLYQNKKGESMLLHYQVPESILNKVKSKISSYKIIYYTTNKNRLRYLLIINR